MEKKVLYGPVTFGRNHSYPSTSITKKVAKMEKFPPVHKLIILLKTRSIFFRKSHNRWKAFAHLAKLKCLMHCGRTFKRVEILRKIVAYSNHKRNDFLPQYCGYVKSDTLYCINPLSSISKTFWPTANFSRILIVGWAKTISCLSHLLKLVAVFQTFTTFHIFFFSSQVQFS